MSEPNRLPPKPPIPIPAKYDKEHVEKNLWPKVKRIAAKVPGVSDVLALYFYMNSDVASLQHKASALASLAYFIIPIDLIPDILGPIGYVDDLAVVSGLIAFIGSEVMKPYRAYARKWLSGGAPAKMPEPSDAKQIAGRPNESGPIITVDPIR